MAQDKYYQEDLAYIHDNNYSGLAVNAAKLVLAELKNNGFMDETVLDLGCGSGRLLKEVSDNGFKTIGVDLSEDLINLAKINSPESQFFHESIWDYEIPKCIAVTAIGEIITYKFDNKNSDENLINLFKNIHAKLVKKGLFIFDFLEPDILENKSYDCKIIRSEEYTMGIEYFENKVKHELKRDITLFRKLENGLFQQLREIHEVRLFETKKITEFLQNTGFTVKETDNYNGLKLRPKHKAIIALKI